MISASKTFGARKRSSNLPDTFALSSSASNLHKILMGKPSLNSLASKKPHMSPSKLTTSSSKLA